MVNQQLKAKEIEAVKRIEISGNEIQMYNSIEHPLFLASDVATWIQHSQTSKMIKTVESEEKLIGTLFLSGQKRDVWFLTEDGLYEVCMQSRKPIAKQFKKEVKTILKQIRQTGGYVETNREEEFIDKYFPSFTDETKLAMIQDLRQKNNQYKSQIKELEPQAQAYMDLMTAQGYLQFIDVAAMVEIGRTKLLEFLRDCKVLTKQSIFNVPYGRFAKNGMFKVITSTSENGHISSVTMVSPKGLNYIYKLIKKKNELDNFNTSNLVDKIHELEVA